MSEQAFDPATAAAPCQIDGCRYSARDAEIARLKEALEDMQRSRDRYCEAYEKVSEALRAKERAAYNAKIPRPHNGAGGA